MASLTLTDKKAREIYPSADAELKSILEESFGGKEFFNIKITDRVKTFKDACDVLGFEHDEEAYDVGGPDVTAYMKLRVIIKALNEGWTPDWNNSNQYKWTPWFYMNKPGFRFFGAHYDDSVTRATGGSRLCLKSRELAEYAGNQFLDLYKDLLS